MDLMCIPLNKQKENDNFVWYKFEIQIKESNKEEFEKRYGIFKFKKDKDVYQKIVAGESPENFISLIEEETDPIFLSDTRILAKCLVKMIECIKNKDFTDTLLYASG